MNMIVGLRVMSLSTALALGACGGSEHVGGSGGTAGGGGAFGATGGSSGGGGLGGSGAMLASGGLDAGSGGLAVGSGATGGMGGVEPMDLGCEPDTIAVRATIDGAPFLREYDVASHAVSNIASSHNLPQWGDLHLRWGTSLMVGQAEASMIFELNLPYSDPELPGMILCGDDGVSARREMSYLHTSQHLARVECPGTPVAGSIDVTLDTLSGNVDGLELPQDVRGALLAPGRVRLLGNSSFFLLTDDPGAEAASGQVLSGRFRDSGVHYCIGGGSFSRPDPDDPKKILATLTNLSRVAPCNELPAVGTIDICIADWWQTEQP